MSELQRKPGTAALIFAKSMVPARKFRVAYTDLHLITNKYRSFKKIEETDSKNIFFRLLLGLKMDYQLLSRILRYLSEIFMHIVFICIAFLQQKCHKCDGSTLNIYMYIFVVLLTTRVYSTLAVILIVLYNITLGNNG